VSLKKISYSNVNQCQKTDEKYCLLIKLNEDEKFIHGVLSDDWNSSESSFVTLTSLSGQKVSIPKTNIDSILHGFSKWNLHFHYKAKVEDVPLGELTGYACLPSDIELEFDSVDAEMWDYLNKHWVIQMLKPNKALKSDS
jgi:hypothetical protein